MYGMINTAIKQLVTDLMGETGWKKVLEKSGIEQNHFEMLSVYDDQVTYKLVASVCEFTGKTPDEILHGFGNFWVPYASKVGYEPLLRLFGPDFKTCLKNLNRMHDHMGAMMPGLVPPEFEIEKENSEKSLVLLYRSKREGLASMVSGLLESLGERYGLKVACEYQGLTEDQRSHRFQVEWN